MAITLDERIAIENRVLYLILNYWYGEKPAEFFPEPDAIPPF